MTALLADAILFTVKLLLPPSLFEKGLITFLHKCPICPFPFFIFSLIYCKFRTFLPFKLNFAQSFYSWSIILFLIFTTTLLSFNNLSTYFISKRLSDVSLENFIICKNFRNKTHIMEFFILNDSFFSLISFTRETYFSKNLYFIFYSSKSYRIEKFSQA